MPPSFRSQSTALGGQRFARKKTNGSAVKTKAKIRRIRSKVRTHRSSPSQRSRRWLYTSTSRSRCLAVRINSSEAKKAKCFCSSPPESITNRRFRPGPPSRGADRTLDLPILTEKVNRLVGEPVCIRDGRYGRVDHCGSHGRVTVRQAVFAFSIWRCTLVHGAHASSFFVYGFSMLTGSNATTR